jgi:N-acetylmuramoyl-L-alanine amidase
VNKPTCIIIHHSLTKDSETVSWGAIRDYHLSKGWREIGYHFGIEMVGDSYEIFLGRFASEDGAHTLGMNQKSIGVCCIGNFDLAPPPKELLEKLKKLVRWLMMVYDIPRETVLGHTDFASYKSCPGIMFDMEKFRVSL